MELELINSLTNSFESFSNKTEDNTDFWFARDLQQQKCYCQSKNGM